MENRRVKKKYPLEKENILCDWIIIKEIERTEEKTAILEVDFKVINNNNFEIAIERPSDSYNILIFYRFLDEVKYSILNPRRGCIQPNYKTMLKNDILIEKMKMEMDITAKPFEYYCIFSYNYKKKLDDKIHSGEIRTSIKKFDIRNYLAHKN